MSAKGWNGKVLTSLLSLAAFILLAVTGLIMYVQPQGRVAYWTDWTFLGLGKDQWGGVHVMTGLLWLVAMLFHLWFNWPPLKQYLTNRAQDSLRFGKELGLAAVALVVVFASGAFGIPPLDYLLKWGEAAKESWVVTPQHEPPFGHAELVSLRGLAAKQRIPLEQALAALKDAGYQVQDPGAKVLDIAHAHGVSPAKLYAVIQPLEAAVDAPPAGEKWTPAKVEETFSGTGLGQKNLEQIAQMLKLEPEAIQSRLRAKGMELQAGETLKQAAARLNHTPLELVTAVLVD